MRLIREKKNENKGKYWKSVWDKLEEILQKGGIDLPNHTVNPNDTIAIQKMANDIWGMHITEQRVALMVLTQFCDSLVWWTQRYKVPEKK